MDFSDVANAGRRVREAKLSRREFQVAQLVAQGLSTKDIAKVFGRSHRTVEIHRGNALKKLDVQNSVELVRVIVLAELDARMTEAVAAAEGEALALTHDADVAHESNRRLEPAGVD